MSQSTILCGGTTLGLLSAFDPLTLLQTERTRSHRASTPGGSQLTSTPARMALRTESFKVMLDLVMGIWMMSYYFIV
jgi:hypothetical protein